MQSRAVSSAQGKVCGSLVAVGQMGSATWQVAGFGRFAQPVMVWATSFQWPLCPQHGVGSTPAVQLFPMSLQRLFILLVVCKGLIGKNGVLEGEEEIYRLINLRRSVTMSLTLAKMP